MGVGRVFDGIDDWLEATFGLPPYGGNVVDSFTCGGWIKTSDSAGVDRAIFSAYDATALLSWGFYWNNGQLKVKYAYRTPATPSDPGVAEEKSVSFSTTLETPVFVAVTAQMNTPGSSAAIPTFRFYAGLTPADIVQIGGSLVASGSIKASSRNFAIGCQTVGTGPSVAVAGTFFNGIMERIGFFEMEDYSIAELKLFAEHGLPHTITSLIDYNWPAGQVFEMWDVLPTGSGPVEKDVSINFFTAVFNGDNVTTGSILPAPSALWTPAANDLGTGRWTASLNKLDNNRILAGVYKSATGAAPAEVWGSDDLGQTWTLLKTFPTSPMQLSIDMMVDLGAGTVIGAGPVLSSTPTIWRSTDYGSTWALVHTLAPSSIQSLLNLGSGTVLAGTGTGGVLLRSTDSGATWSTLATVAALGTFRSITDLGGGTLLAGGNVNNIYRSTDSGANWASYSTMSPGTNGQVVMRSLGAGRIIAATSLGNAYLSTDSGATWNRTLDTNDWLAFYDNEPEGTILGPIDGLYFLRARTHGYVYVSSDDGSTWIQYYYNSQGVTTQEAAVLVDDKIIFSGNYWLCSSALRFYGLSFPVPEVPQIRDTSQRRTFVFIGKIELCAPFLGAHLGACCSAVVLQAPAQGRTESANPPPGATVPDQGRTIPYVEETPPTVGTAHVTQIQKFVEYHLPSSTPGTCSLRVRIRILRVSDLVQVFELDQYQSLQYSKRWTELNDFTLILSADSEQGNQMRQLGIVPSNGQYICNIVIDELSDFAGFIDHINIHITNRGEHIWTLQGNGCDRILADRVLLPPAGFSSDSYEGPAESIMKAIVDRHLVNPITTGIPNINDADRTVLQLVIAPDIGTGEIVKLEGRFQKVHEALLQISKSSDDIGFDVAVFENNLVFEVSEGMDRSASAVLAVELDNMADFVYDKDGTQFASHVIMGGSGEADARLLTATSTATSVRANIERREAFQDSRDLLTLATLDDKGKSLLQDKGQVDTFGGRILLGSSPCYRRDYQVGDFITIKSFLYDIGQVVRVMEARVVVEGGQLEQCDLTFVKPPKRFIETLRTLPPTTATARN